MAIQYSTLPGEITDAIIDHLHSDLRALGVCSMVCSKWLNRSRYHIFATVQLWPWRIHRFFELAKSRSCTFTHHIHRIELDDLRTRAEEKSRDIRPTRQGNDERVTFNEAMAQSYILCFSQVKSMQVKNVDWTALSPMQHGKLRERLAKFSKLNRLELQGVIFHDLREVIRVVSSFPSLRQLSAQISFLKYLEYVIASASTLRLPSNVQTIELGTDEGIPVILGCLAGREEEPHVLVLKLKNVKYSHLQYISTTLKKSKPNLQHFSLGFARETLQTIDTGSSTCVLKSIGIEFSNLDDLVKAVDLSHLSELRTLCIEGLRIQENQSLSTTLVPILQRIESSFLESIDLGFLLDANTTLACFNWQSLERVLLMHHFFGLRLVRVTIVLEEATTDKREFVEQWIRRAMSDLNSREILTVRVMW